MRASQLLQNTCNLTCRAVLWMLWVTLLWAPSFVQAEGRAATPAGFDAPMSCAAVALLRATDYPEAVSVYDEGQPPRSFAEADRATLGLLWRHRQQFAEAVAARAFTDLSGEPPTLDVLRDARNRWMAELTTYPEPLREAIGTNCEALFEGAEQWCPMGGRTP